MGLTERKEEILKQMPKIETKITKIEGKNLIKHQTIITDVKPIQYYNAVIVNKEKK